MSETLESGTSFPGRETLFENATEIYMEDVAEKRRQVGELGFLKGTVTVKIYKRLDGTKLLANAYFAGDGHFNETISIIDPATQSCLEWHGPAIPGNRPDDPGVWRDRGALGYQQVSTLIDKALQSGK